MLSGRDEAKGILPPVNLAFFLSVSVFFIIVFICFSPCLKNGFTNFDDPDYVTGNSDIQGDPLHSLLKVFSSTYSCNYQPVTMVTYILDYRLFGQEPWGYHLTSLLFHLLNCLLIFLIASRLSRNHLASAIGALLFGLNPLRVESVAWIAARKDVVSAFFYFAALLLYLYYAEQGRRRWYFLSLGAGLLSLLAKPVAVSLPCALLLLDYLERRPIDRRALLDKPSFFILALVFRVITLLIQQNGGAMHSSFTLWQRIALPFYGLVFYLFKTIFPFRLCALYSPASFTNSGLLLIAAPLIVLVATWILFRIRRQSHIVLFAALFYVVTLLPMLQIVPVGWAPVAERYAYIPFSGAAIAAALMLSRFGGRGPALHRAAVGIIGVVLLVWGYCTFFRCTIWKDGMTLWNNVLASCPGAQAYNNRALLEEENRNGPAAEADFSRAIASDTAFAPACNNLGLIYMLQSIHGSVNTPIRGLIADSALFYFTMAISRDHAYAHAYDNRRNLLLELGRSSEAIEDFSRAIALLPQVPEFYYDRGAAFQELGSFDSAIDDFSLAIALKPDFAAALKDRGLAWARKGQYRGAASDFTASLAVNPSDTEVRNNLDQVRRALELH